MNPEDRIRIYEEIFQLVYNSNGGFTWDEAYSMPVPIRYFNIKMLVRQKEKEKEASEKQPDTKEVRHKGPPPNILPRKPTK